MSFSTLTYEKGDGLAVVTLSRPQWLNIYNVRMRDELWEVLGAARDDDEVRAVIFAGAGRAFCAGADLTEFGTAPSVTVARHVRWERDVWGRLDVLPQLTIAAMHGYALGTGLELALLCDLRLAAEGTVLGLPEVSLGFIPAAGGTQTLARVVGPAQARRLILGAERIDAAEAWRIGLVHRVVPREALLAEAEALARRICQQPAAAIRRAKEAVKRGIELPLASALELERRLAGLLAAERGGPRPASASPPAPSEG
ncbi:MAG: enoyl-CoA hydratase/isomerase family protein [Chloroflexi bacterium]|nr:enoyl-CoA hydratase/isomerase family protein [Chloroflexota bacterium]MBI4505296.1 enoyl-CoA hydratase/isomerase family protein [Chloroflexota bacterium]